MLIYLGWVGPGRFLLGLCGVALCYVQMSCALVCRAGLRCFVLCFVLSFEISVWCLDVLHCVGFGWVGLG